MFTAAAKNQTRIRNNVDFILLSLLTCIRTLGSSIWIIELPDVSCLRLRTIGFKRRRLNVRDNIIFCFHRCLNGTCGRIRTDTGAILSRLSLPLDYTGIIVNTILDRLVILCNLKIHFV
jgi:hypothetical protein